MFVLRGFYPRLTHRAGPSIVQELGLLRTWASKGVSLGEYGDASIVPAKHSLVGFEGISMMYMPANGCTILVIGPEIIHV